MTNQDIPRHSAFQWLCLLLLVLRGVAGAPNPRPSQPNLLAPRSDLVQAEQCGQNCTSCATQSSNSAITNKKGENSLSKRVIVNPWDPPYNGQNDEAYVMNMIGESTIMPLNNSRGNRYPTAFWQSFGSFPFNIAFGSLSGCVMGIVISDVGAWVAHFPEVGGIGRENWMIGSEEEFQHYILDEILSTRANNDMVGLNSFLFSPFEEQHNPQAFVIRRASSGHYYYDMAYRLKTEWIGSAIKKATGLDPTVFEYNVFRLDLPLRIKGVGLLQYDPNVKGGNRGNCDPHWAMWRLWMETDIVKQTLFESPL